MERVDLFQAFKRHWKFFLCTFLYVSIDAIVRATSQIMEYAERGSSLQAWKPFVWEFSSTFIVLIMVPLILIFDERNPISSKSWPRRIVMHIPLSFLFSALHITGMIALRKFIYFLMGDHYDYGEINYAILYEYRKDIMTYCSILLVIYAYREILRLRNGEAQIEVNDEERIMVSKAGQFKFIEPSSVDWVEAAGNYVELHVGEDKYMLRATMKDIGRRLGNNDFARVHRSTIIRRDLIESIKPLSNGDKKIYLKGGVDVRASRRYHENLTHLG